MINAVYYMGYHCPFKSEIVIGSADCKKCPQFRGEVKEGVECENDFQIIVDGKLIEIGAK